MRIRTIGLMMTLVLGLLEPSRTAEAQQSGQIPRIGYLTAGTLSSQTARIEAFRQGLRELGYIEGTNVVMEWRFAEREFDRLPALVDELLRLKVDVIVSAGPTVTRAAKNATTTIPIVMGFDNDPVGSGVVASLARPGGNVTGLSTLAPELSGKQLELLKEIVPKLSRVAVIGRSAEPGYAQVTRELDRGAALLNVKLRYVDVPNPKDTLTAFRAVSEEGVDAVLLLASPVSAYRKQIVELAVQIRMPTVYWNAEFVDAGGLIYYGPSYADLFRRAAKYVDKILQGAKPAELAVEQPVKFDLVINLKTAKQLGITIPPLVLYQATRVIQ